MSIPTRPRTITVVALFVAWLSVSTIFLSLAKPIQEFTGDLWGRIVAVTAICALIGWVAAYGLWAQKGWGRWVLHVWSLSAAAAWWSAVYVMRGAPMLIIAVVGAAVVVTIVAVAVSGAVEVGVRGG